MSPLDDEEGDSEEVISDEGPWVLVASASGLGKRVPVRQFRLQKRAGQVIISVAWANERRKKRAWIRR